MNKDSAIEFIKANNMIGLKAGRERSDFLYLWMVVVQDRIFARSWGFAEKSWYNTFINEPSGEIKCGEMVFNIAAQIPKDFKALTPLINNAYLEKYNFGVNAEYAQGIIEQKHIDKTMEFVIVGE
jgi:hypothetical protein